MPWTLESPRTLPLPLGDGTHRRTWETRGPTTHRIGSLLRKDSKRDEEEHQESAHQTMYKSTRMETTTEYESLS